MSNQQYQQPPPHQQPSPQFPYAFGHPQLPYQQQPQQQQAYTHVSPGLPSSWPGQESLSRSQPQQQRHHQQEQQQQQQQSELAPTAYRAYSIPSTAIPSSSTTVLQYNLGQQQQQQPQQQQPRKRIAQSACETCRRKRTRCVPDASGDCLNCIALGVECIFSGVDRRKESIKDLRARAAYLEQLVERIRSTTGGELEKVIEEVKQSSTEAGLLGLGRDRASSAQSMNNGLPKEQASSPSESFPNKRPRRADTGRSDDQDLKPRPRSSAAGKAQEDTSSSSSSTRRTSLAFDPLGSVSKMEDESLTANLTELVDRLTISNDGTIRAVGATSNELFSVSSPHTLEDLPLSTLVPAADQANRNVSRLGSEDTDFTAAEVAEHIVMSGVRLPPNTTSDTIEHLLNLFFIWHQCVFPILSRRAFLESSMYGGEYFCPLLLNVILAFASQWSDLVSIRTDPNDPHTAGDAFFDIAKSLLDDHLDRPSITTVQSLCIMASRESGCGRDTRGWLYNGLCARLAMALGLHLDPTPLLAKGILTERDVCIRVITFWEAWYFDKEYSALIGRPSSMIDMVVTCPVVAKLRMNPRMDAFIRIGELDWLESARTGVAISKVRTQRSSTYQVHPTITTGMMDLASMYVGIGALYDRTAARLYYSGERRANAGLSKVAPPKEQLLDIDVSTAEFRNALASFPHVSIPGEARQGDQALDAGHKEPFLQQLYMISYCCILLLNRPFLSRQCPKWMDAGHDQTDCPLVHRAIDDEGSPRAICFDAAQKIAKLYELWRSSAHSSPLPVNNSLQHCLFCAATVLVVESEESIDLAACPKSQERKKLAEHLLHDKILVWYEDLGKRRLSGKKALDSIRSLMAARKEPKAVKTETAQASSDVDWTPAPSTVPLHRVQEDARADSPSRPTLAEEDSGVSVSDKHVIGQSFRTDSIMRQPQQQYSMGTDIVMAIETGLRNPIYASNPAFTNPDPTSPQIDTSQQWTEVLGPVYPTYQGQDYLQFSAGNAQSTRAAPSTQVQLNAREALFPTYQQGIQGQQRAGSQAISRDHTPRSQMPRYLPSYPQQQQQQQSAYNQQQSPLGQPTMPAGLEQRAAPSMNRSQSENASMVHNQQQQSSVQAQQQPEQPFYQPLQQQTQPRYSLPSQSQQYPQSYQMLDQAAYAQQQQQSFVAQSEPQIAATQPQNRQAQIAAGPSVGIIPGTRYQYAGNWPENGTVYQQNQFM